MVEVKLKNINKVKSKLADGTRIEYHSIRNLKNSRFWKSTDDVQIGSPEYISAYLKAIEPRSAIGKTRNFDSIISEYLASNAFRGLSVRTQQDYRKWLDRIRDRFGSAPIPSFNDPKIRPIAMKWRDTWEGRNADYAWTVLRLVVSWARNRGLLEQHHLTGGGRVYQSDRSDIIWTEDDVVLMEKDAPLFVARAIRAAVETGLRPGDLVRLSTNHIESTPHGQRIRIRTNKTGASVSIPVTPKMAEVISAASGSFILTNNRGEQLSEQWLSKAVGKARKSAGITRDLRLYDARGSAATRLILVGATLQEIAQHMGWSMKTAAAMVERYATLDPSLAESVAAKLQAFTQSK